MEAKRKKIASRDSSFKLFDQMKIKRDNTSKRDTYTKREKWGKNQRELQDQTKRKIKEKRTQGKFKTRQQALISVIIIAIN